VGDIEVDGKTLGRLAFEAYCEGVGGLTFDGKPIPGWDELHGDRLKVQGGWEAAAAEVARWVRGSDVANRRSGGRWRPLSASLPPAEEPLPHVAQDDQVGDERAAQAADTVPVVAEVDDEPDPRPADDDAR